MALKRWIEQRPPYPSGVVGVWFAIEAKQAWCGIFKLIGGEVFMLVYLEKGNPKPVNERFPSFTLAQQRAIDVMNTKQLQPRPSLPHK